MKKVIFITLVSLVIILTSCAHEYIRSGDGNAVFLPVAPQEAARLTVERQGLQIVDTRTGWERSSGWIANSVHISYFTFLFGGGYDKLDKERPVLLICAHGTRSYRVGRSLIKKGWKEVYDLDGGMKAWLKDGYSVVTKQEGLPVEDSM